MPERPQLKPKEVCVTVVCDGLHPDDLEELRRSLADSHYDFKVDVAQKVRTENYPELLVIGIHTKLVVRFSAKWFYGRTRNGGVKAVVKAIDEVLDRSLHDRDRKPKVSFDSNGQELITTETWLRPRTKKHSWSRDHKLALGILILTGVAAFAAILVVPEFRRFFHLDKPEASQQIQPEKQTSTPNVTESSATPVQNTEPPKPAEAYKQKSRPTQKTQTHVTGNGNVAGNDISGDNNVTGNNNQTGPLAVAPNGIAITGGTVNNPTVNNVSALPDLTMSDEQEKRVADSLGQSFAGVDVSITIVQATQTTRDFSERLGRILKASGANNIEFSTAWMYVPNAGTSLHKGMSVTSFPPEQKDVIDKLANALGAVGVIQVLPIYNVTDKKVNIVVNRSAETREEAKQ
jgi:hypothetical protein